MPEDHLESKENVQDEVAKIIQLLFAAIVAGQLAKCVVMRLEAYRNKGCTSYYDQHGSCCKLFRLVILFVGTK